MSTNTACIDTNVQLNEAPARKPLFRRLTVDAVVSAGTLLMVVASIFHNEITWLLAEWMQTQSDATPADS